LVKKTKGREVAERSVLLRNVVQLPHSYFAFVLAWIPTFPVSVFAESTYVHHVAAYCNVSQTESYVTVL